MSFYNQRIEFSELLGKTLVSVSGETGDDEMYFNTVEGQKYILYHDQDCCETVRIEDIIGDLEDLVDSPITMAEEVTEDEPYAGYDSYTWTFYKLATVKGYVTIRWLGESNGYYSESVDFRLA